MSINFGGEGSSSPRDYGGSPTSASEAPQMSNDDGAQGMEIMESPNLNATKPPRPPQKRKQRSYVWNHFKVELNGSGSKTCQCLYCGHKYHRVSSKSGTGNLHRHLDSCARKKTKDVGEILSEGKSKFDPVYFRELLCSAIVVHDLPFRFVEYERIVACFEYLKWDIKLMTRNKVKADVLKMYEREKIGIKSRLGKILVDSI